MNKLDKAKIVSYGIIYHLIRWILAFFYIGFFTAGGIIFLKYSFLNKTLDTTTYTSILFGIFAALTSISFSWSKTYPIDSEPYKIINFYGERMLLSAIIFLAASIVKYVYIIYSHKADLKQIKLFILSLEFLYWVFEIAFIAAYTFATMAVYELLAFLLKKHIRKPNQKALFEILKLNQPNQTNSKSE